MPVAVLKVELICWPSARAPATMPIEIRAAMRPYSMAVAPELVLRETLDKILHDTLPGMRELAQHCVTLFWAVEAPVNVARRFVDWRIFR